METSRSFMLEEKTKMVVFQNFLLKHIILLTKLRRIQITNPSILFAKKCTMYSLF